MSTEVDTALTLIWQRREIDRLQRRIKSQSDRIKYLCESIRRITRTAQGVNLNG